MHPPLSPMVKKGKQLTLVYLLNKQLTLVYLLNSPRQLSNSPNLLMHTNVFAITTVL